MLKDPQKSPTLDCGMVFFIVFDPGDPDVFDPEEGTGKILVAKGFQQVWRDCGRGRTEKRRWDRIAEKGPGATGNAGRFMATR